MPDSSGNSLSDLHRRLEEMNCSQRDREEKLARADIQRSQWAVSSPQPQPARADYPEVMPLNVGGRRFEVSRTTLTASGLFRHLLSDKYSWAAQPDGSYFVDADPDIFEHLLRFMRRPGIFPLFWTQSAGFDYALYHRVQTEARHFKIEALCEWIKGKRYVDAVSVHTLKPVCEGLGEMAGGKRPGNHSEECYVIRRVEKVYLCPRGIYVHRGRAELCGAACQQAQKGHPIEYEDVDSLQVTTVGRIVTFDETVCEMV